MKNMTRNSVAPGRVLYPALAAHAQKLVYLFGEYYIQPLVANDQQLMYLSGECAISSPCELMTLVYLSDECYIQPLVALMYLSGECYIQPLATHDQQLMYPGTCRASAKSSPW
jgi:hypothetical protein